MRLRGLILCILLAMVALAACSDDPPDPPAPESEPAAQQTQQPATTEPAVDSALLTPRWPRDSWRPLSQVAQANAELQLLIKRNLDWCAESVRRSAPGGARWGAAAVDGRWSELAGPTLLDRGAQPWIDAVIEATAEARGLSVSEVPSIQVSSRQWLEAASCESWYPRYGDRDPTRFDPQWWWHVSLGLIRPSWTPHLIDYMDVPDIYGWITYSAAVKGSITLLAPLPPSEMAQTLSALTVRHLQRDLLPGGEFDRSFDVHGYDHLLALYWLLEADEAHAALDASHEAIVEASEQIDAPTSGGFIEERAGYLDFPAEVSDWLASPIRDGPELIERLLREVGPDAVSERLRNPPDTMEQLLHAEKYESREPALDMSALDPMLESVLPSELWARLGPNMPGMAESRNRLGEYYLRLLISASTGREAEATAAAAGWGGDRLYAYQSRTGAGTLALWAIAFDDAIEDAEGAAGLREWLIAFSDGQARRLDGDRLLGWDAPNTAIRVLDHLNTVWVIAGDAAAVSQTTANLLRQDEPFAWWP